VFTEVLGLVRQAYVDQPDMGTLIAGALDGTTDALDPFSMYVPAGEVESYLQARNVGILPATNELWESLIPSRAIKKPLVDISGFFIARLPNFSSRRHQRRLVSSLRDVQQELVGYAVKTGRYFRFGATHGRMRDTKAYRSRLARRHSSPQLL
jgi:hypothetical protein